MARILLIEDDDLLRKMLRIYLEQMGDTVTEARNGREGLASYVKAATDLVITDLVMPDQEGLATIMELKKHDPATKIIAVSGGGWMLPEAYLHTARQLGAARTLAKPFSAQALADVVAEVLGRPSVPIGQSKPAAQ